MTPASHTPICYELSRWDLYILPSNGAVIYWDDAIEICLHCRFWLLVWPPKQDSRMSSHPLKGCQGVGPMRPPGKHFSLLFSLTPHGGGEGRERVMRGGCWQATLNWTWLIFKCLALLFSTWLSGAVQAAWGTPGCMWEHMSIFPGPQNYLENGACSKTSY